MTATLPRPRLVPAAEAAPLRAVIYTRVSTDPHDRGRSVAEQEAECRATCERNGWPVAQVFTDNDRSASRYATKARPEHRKLIKLIESGAVDVLVTWESSRAQRDLDAYVTLRRVCESTGVLWSYKGRTYDMSESADRFQTGLDALLDERSSEETRERVLRAVRANADRGRPHGKLLYGYRRVYDEHSGALVEQVPDPVTAPLVVEAARRVLGGETPYAVAQDYNQRGIPTPRGAANGWDLSQIRRMLINPGYAGKRVHQGKVIGDADWPAIIPEADHLALVAKLGDPKRRTVRDSSIRHLLSGIAVCGVCGGRVRVQKNRGFLAYLCITGFHVSRSQEKVDALVTEYVLARLEQPDLADALAGPASTEQEAALAQARELRARLDGFYDAAAAGELTPQALSRIEARLLPEVEAADARARAAVTSPLVAATAGADARAKWEKLPITGKREIISTLVTVRLLPTVRGARSFRPESVQIDWR